MPAGQQLRIHTAKSGFYGRKSPQIAFATSHTEDTGSQPRAEDLLWLDDIKTETCHPEPGVPLTWCGQHQCGGALLYRPQKSGSEFVGSWVIVFKQL